MASPSTQSVNIREDDIDNEMIIEEVEKRPALYDKKLKEYSDINLKIKTWEEISRIIFSNVWGNLSQQEKTEAEETYTYEKFILHEELVDRCRQSARGGALQAVPATALASAESLADASPMARRTKNEIAAAQRGRTPEWYNKCYGHICALYLARIRASFKHNTEGPESNV